MRFNFSYAPPHEEMCWSRTPASLDMVLYVRRSCNPLERTELACNDDTLARGNASQLDLNLTQGQTVYVVVDSFGALAVNTFTLTISPTP